jgi:hypothetical protein
VSNPVTGTVDAIGKMNFEGNIIPQSWYQNIRMENGKVDLAGCAILADIVYWYRPSEVRDEITGRLLGYKRKFRGERLQRSYEQQGEMLGLTKDQARDAMNRLAEAGLLIITVENGVRFGNGVIGNGVVYVEPIPEALAEITYRPIPATEAGRIISPPTPDQNPTMLGKESEGNTETSQEISSSLSKGGEPKAKEPEAKTPKQEALESLEKVFFQYGGTLSPPLIERFYAVVDGNPDHPTERFAHAKKKLEETRSFFKAIDAYREWTLPKPQSTYQRPKPGIGRASPPRAAPAGGLDYSKPITEADRKRQFDEIMAQRRANGMSVPGG